MLTECKKIIVQPYDGTSTVLCIGRCGRETNGEVEFLVITGQDNYSFEQSADTIDISDKLNGATNANKLIADRLGIDLKQAHFSNQKSFIPGAIENKATVEGATYANDRVQRLLKDAIAKGEALWFEERAYNGGYTRQFLGYIGSYKEEAKKGDKVTFSCDILVTSNVYEYPSFYGTYVGDPVIIMAPNTFEMMVEIDSIVDYKEKVIATDSKGAEITNVKVDDTAVDLSKAGRYPVYYTATDTEGNSTLATRDYVVVPLKQV